VPLPRIGHVRTHEPTVKLARSTPARRVLSMTVAREGERWFCSLSCEVERADPPAANSPRVVGVDVGVRHLVVEDLLGMRGDESQAAPVRADVPL